LARIVEVMPFKSQAQRRKFAQLLVEGKISPQTFEEWNRETGDRKLPERAGDVAKPKRVGAKKKTMRKAKSGELSHAQSGKTRHQETFTLTLTLAMPVSSTMVRSRSKKVPKANG
jgi:hypothetical protein